MRRITLTQILLFQAILISILACAAGSAWYILHRLSPGFGGAAWFLLSLPFSLVYSVLAFRLYWHFFAFPPGEIAIGSPEEARYHVYVLFFLMLFYPLMRSNLLPTPLTRLFYWTMGARMGDNSYTGGLILDPPLVSIGDHCLLGMGTTLIPHIIEGEQLAHHPIHLGNRVTLGAYSTVMGGAIIGDGAVVAMHSVVAKHTRIPPGEVWGGVPARCLKPAATPAPSDGVEAH